MFRLKRIKKYFIKLIQQDLFSTPGMQHMFNAVGSILEKMIDLLPSDYKFVSYFIFCPLKLLKKEPKIKTKTKTSEGACGRLETKSASRGKHEVPGDKETLWTGVF